MGTFVDPARRVSEGILCTLDHYPVGTFGLRHLRTEQEPGRRQEHSQWEADEDEHPVRSSALAVLEQDRWAGHRWSCHHWRHAVAPPRPCERCLPPSYELSIPCESP